MCLRLSVEVKNMSSGMSDVKPLPYGSGPSERLDIGWTSKATLVARLLYSLDTHDKPGVINLQVQI